MENKDIITSKGGGYMHKLMTKVIIVALVLIFLTACSAPESKYSISNDSDLLILDSEYEKLYEKAKNAAFAYIDIIEEDEYLSAEESKLKVFGDKSAVFLLKTVDKPEADDDSIMVTFAYLPDEKNWQRENIVYNNTEYGNN